MRIAKATEDGLCCPESAVYAGPAVRRTRARIFSALFRDTMVGERSVGPDRADQVSC